MRRLSPSGQRRAIGFGIAGLLTLTTYWYLFSDGLPIIWGPSARASDIAAGRVLFEHEWEANDPLAHGDGLGPVFNAKSCATCHFQGGLGGGGGKEHNALAFEVHPRSGDETFRNGTIHNFSIAAVHQESVAGLRKMFPIISGRTFTTGSPGCQTTTVIPDFDPVQTQTVQATALFGAGWIDLISDRAILRNARTRGLREGVRELSGEFAPVPIGRVRRVTGGVGKFGWKAQFANLDEFVAAACANELGLGTPMTEQAKPFRGPNTSSAPDLDRKQFRSLVAFVKTLPKPVEIANDHAARGKELFASVGCAICHVPNMGGVKGVYSDFLLYTLVDPPPPGSRDDYSSGPPPQLNLPERSEDDPRPNEWKTPPLWGVADSAPYMHDGSAGTLRDAIQAHRGDARAVTKKFLALGADEQAALLSFLGTLKAPPDAHPLRNPDVTKMVRK